MKKNNYQGVLQQPIGTGYNASTTAAEVIKGKNLSGKNVIITGGYAGIGLETTRVLTAAGAKVIVPARDVQKAQKNLEGINGVTVEPMDLMDPTSIDAFANRFLSTNNPLHLLINNAGIMWVPLRRDSRGNESQFSTNHLGHFQLTARLWPALKKANGARVISVSSYGHHEAPFNFEDPNFLHRDYHTLLGYGQSKTANNLFTVELDKRGAEHNVRAFVLHPGAVGGTDLGREADIELFRAMGLVNADGSMKPEVLASLKTVPQGAATTVWCATSEQLNEIGGVYCEDADVAVLDKGDIEHKYDVPSSMHGVMAYSVDKENAQRLWQLSEQLTGITFNAN